MAGPGGQKAFQARTDGSIQQTRKNAARKFQQSSAYNDGQFGCGYQNGKSIPYATGTKIGSLNKGRTAYFHVVPAALTITEKWHQIS
jgi:hypothetical protein